MKTASVPHTVSIRDVEDGLEASVPATLEMIDTLDDACTAWLNKHHTAIDVFALRICLRESLLNAVTHGSGVDPSKAVQLRLSVSVDGVRLQVRDSGVGFCWRSAKEDVDVLGDGGRGLPLMKIYADELIFNEQGNVVTVFKRFARAESSGAMVSEESEAQDV